MAGSVPDRISHDPFGPGLWAGIVVDQNSSFLHGTHLRQSRLDSLFPDSTSNPTQPLCFLAPTVIQGSRGITPPSPDLISSSPRRSAPKTPPLTRAMPNDAQHWPILF